MEVSTLPYPEPGREPNKGNKPRWNDLLYLSQGKNGRRQAFSSRNQLLLT